MHGCTHARLKRLAGALTLGGAACMGGCEQFNSWFESDSSPETQAIVSKSPKPPKTTGKPTTSPVEKLLRKKPPTYAQAARTYNQNLKLMDRVSARVNILLSYYDDEGELHTEDPEGRLQIVRPNKLALSLGKAGQILFWLGCDPEQYWWLDLSDKSKRIAAIGKHEKFDDATAERIGLPIKPLDLIRVVGVVPFDVSVKGATQWSDDGQLLGITTPIGDRGFERVWVDPKTYMTTMVEIFDKDREKIIVAEHEGRERMEVTRDIPGASLEHVFLPSRVFITHLPTETQARLTLTGVKDGPITDKAFDLPILLTKYPVDRTVDLDKNKK